MICSKCGAQIRDGVAFCPNCGAKQGSPATAQAQAQDGQQSQGAAQQQAQPKQQVQTYAQQAQAYETGGKKVADTQNLSLVGLICGIAGLVFELFINMPIGLILGIVAIVASGLAMSRNKGGNNGQAIAGLVCGIIVVVIGIPVCICGAALCSAGVTAASLGSLQ